MINLNQVSRFINTISSVCDINGEIFVNYGLLYTSKYNKNIKSMGMPHPSLCTCNVFYNVTSLQYFSNEFQKQHNVIEGNALHLSIVKPISHIHRS